MTIRYEVLVKGADDDLRELLTEEYCCYGSVNRKIVKMEEVDDGYKSIRLFSPRLFRGIKLHLAWDTPYGQQTTARQRKQYQTLFADLGFYQWLGIGHSRDKGKWFEQTKDKFDNVDSFTFTKDCPMFLAVAATGIWRMFSNAPDLYQVYQALHVVHDLHPHTALIGALQARGNSLTNMHALTKTNFGLQHLETHMPWSYLAFDSRCLSRLMHLTHEDFAELPSMFDEQKETGGLSYDGRDNWFLGRKLKSKNQIDSTLDYMCPDIWQRKWAETSKDRFSTREIRGSKLLEWLKELEKEAILLHGYPLQHSLIKTQGYIKEARIRTAKAKAKKKAKAKAKRETGKAQAINLSASSPMWRATR